MIDKGVQSHLCNLGTLFYLWEFSNTQPPLKLKILMGVLIMSSTVPDTCYRLAFVINNYLLVLLELIINS